MTQATYTIQNFISQLRYRQIHPNLSIATIKGMQYKNYTHRPIKPKKNNSCQKKTLTTVKINERK